jgi:hypothetical protein
VAFLVIGPACLIAPIVAMKGGLSTKPAVGRLLGTTARSADTAVERQRPRDPDQTAAQTVVLAARAMAISVRDAVTVPLIPLALLGLIWSWPPGARARPWIFLGVILVAWPLALVRLHATSGYCTPRHALIVAYPLIASAAFALCRLRDRIAIPGRWLGLDDVRYTAGPAVTAMVLVGLAWSYRAEVAAPINGRFAGYRGAAEYVAGERARGGEGGRRDRWTLFYGERTGYTFANLVAAAGDPTVRRMVVRDAHLAGPWWYCTEIRKLIGDRKPVASFPEKPSREQSVVYVYDWSDRAVQSARGVATERR